MKTKTFLLVCLILGVGLTQLSAQNGKNGNGAVSEYYTWDGYYIDLPVVCGEDAVDRLVGFASSHIINFYKNGVKVGEKQTFSGEVTNSRTGEIFEIKDTYKCDLIDRGGPGHWNLKGDQGSHYIIFYYYYWDTDTFEFLKANCH